ncbi:MAG: hypothetical protein KBC24_06645, partial [Caldisericia bacterium]|nr:hypothetical protein [Caldisericia bacterium]
APPPPPAGATTGGSADTDLASDPTPKSWCSNVLENDTIRLPFNLMGECKGQAPVNNIEISLDGGSTWFKANLNTKTNEWSYELNTSIQGSTYQLLTRATDKAGRTERTVNPNLDVRYRKRPVTINIVSPGTGRE